GFAIARDGIAEAFTPLAERFAMNWGLHFSDYVPRIAVFASTLPHCLYDLLARWRMGEFRAQVPIIISNHDQLRGIAESFGLEYRRFEITPETKGAQESHIAELLEEHRIDVVVLARYMQIIGSELVSLYPDRIINIHHSFLPAFAGARPYHHAHERGVK